MLSTGFLPLAQRGRIACSHLRWRRRSVLRTRGGPTCPSLRAHELMGERSRGCCDSSSLPKGKNVSRVSVSSPMLPRTLVTPLDTVTLPASASRDVVTHAPPPLAASRVRLLRSSAADARTGPLPPLPLPASSPTPSPTFPLSRPACSCGTCVAKELRAAFGSSPPGAISNLPGADAAEVRSS